MSDVISFRLDKDNPREEKARQVLKAWFENGYSLRYIMTEALLRLDLSQRDQVDSVDLNEVNGKLDHINQLLEWMGNTQPNSVTKNNTDAFQDKLPDTFLTSIKQSAKPGLKLD